MVKVTADATTQVIHISQGEGAREDNQIIALYPSMVPHLCAQLMQASVMLGLNQDFPIKGGPVTFKKGN